MLTALILAAGVISAPVEILGGPPTKFDSLGYPCTQYCDALIVPGWSCDFRGEKKRCETTGDKCAPGWVHIATEPSTGQLICRPPVNSLWKK